MNDLRIAAQQALEALENALDAQSNPMRQDFPTIHDFGQMRRAHTDLRAALAQQEPVARVLQTVGQYHTGRFVAEVETVRRLRDGENLYTAPPRREWQGLTEEEKADILFPLTAAGASDMDCARAIEAKLKERNT